MKRQLEAYQKTIIYQFGMQYLKGIGSAMFSPAWFSSNSALMFLKLYSLCMGSSLYRLLTRSGPK